MEKSLDDLKHIFDLKIKRLEQLVNDALSSEILSENRMMIGLDISVILRSLCCYSNEATSLVERTGLIKKLLFVLEENNTGLNLLQTFTLVSYSVSNNVACFNVNDDLWNYEDKRGIILNLSFSSWLNEIVIDFKTKSKFLSLSRSDIIHILCDKEGGHVDSIEDDRVLFIKNPSSYTLSFRQSEGAEITFRADNLLTETILGIAMELCQSYKIVGNEKMEIVGPYNNVLYVYRNTDKNKKTSYIYSVYADKVNINVFYPDCYDKECIYKFSLSSYRKRTKFATFNATLIDINKLDFSDKNKFHFDPNK